VGLGEVLLEQGAIDDATLQIAVTEQRSSGVSLAKALLQLGAVDERQLVAGVARQMGVPFADCSPGAVDPDAASLLPQDVAAELQALPVSFTPDQGLLVALVDPHDDAALQQVGTATGFHCHAAMAVRADLQRAIAHLAGGPGAIREAPRPAAVTTTTEPAAAAGGALPFEREMAFDLDGALNELLDRGGSDLHITNGIPPAIRVHGDLEHLRDVPPLTPDDIRQAVYGILTQRQRQEFENGLELDVSYTVPGKARFRVNVFQQRESLGAVLRVIPFEIKSIEALGIPPQILNFAHLQRGFVLVTGPTGSGKSTTLASLIDVVNRERAGHIMTVEDPIEFLHQHKRSVVNQREVGTDTHSFADALKHVLRQDPDVILVGELRDLETIQVALTAAETGHLVFATLHTQDAPQTIDRIVDVFPPHQQEQIRVMLSGALQGVVCQQLLKTIDGRGRVAVCEVMMATTGIRNLIREGKTHQMYSALQAGKSQGMITMDQSLAELVIKGTISYDVALEHCHHVPDFNRLCGRA